MDVTVREGLYPAQQVAQAEGLAMLVELLVEGHENASLAMLFQVDVWTFKQAETEYLEQHPAVTMEYHDLLLRWLEGLGCQIYHETSPY